LYKKQRRQQLKSEDSISMSRDGVVVFASQASTISLNRFSCLREIVSQSIQLPSVEALIFFLDLVLTLLFTTICPWYWYQVGERERFFSPFPWQPAAIQIHGERTPPWFWYSPSLLHLLLHFFPTLTKLKLRLISFIPTSQVSLIVFLECLHPLMT
jgi:hypothetical protein